MATEPTPLTHAELDLVVTKLQAVGSPYDFIAGWVEHQNRPHCLPNPEAA